MKLALLAICACAPDRTYETRHGLEVFDTVGLYPIGDIETATELLIEARGAGRRVLRILDVRFQADAVYLAGAYVPGAYYSDIRLAVVQTISECLAGTAFVHELSHHLEWQLDGQIDYLHKGEPWQPGGWVRVAEARAADALCP